MDAELAQALVIDKVSSVGLLLAGLVVVWRRYSAASERLIATLQAQTAEVTAKLVEVKGAVEAGLAGLKGQVEEHGRQLDRHRRRLDRHSVLIRAVESGVRPRPQLVAEDEHE